MDYWIADKAYSVCLVVLATSFLVRILAAMRNAPARNCGGGALSPDSCTGYIAGYQLGVAVMRMGRIDDYRN